MIRRFWNSRCPRRGRWHYVAWKFIGMYRRIKVTVVVSVVATIVAASLAEVVVERAAPVWLAHSRNIESRIVKMIEIDVSIAHVVDNIRVAIKHWTALAARCKREYDSRNRNPAKVHSATHFPPMGFFKLSTSRCDRLERFCRSYRR